ncbi:MAG: response regulator transcription factor [Patescibacteria group bacterium]
MRELEARINSIFKRRERITEYTFGDISIDLERRSFKKNNENVPLTQKEFLILEVLLKNKSKPVSRTDIIEYAWGG